jgi:Ca-activated chloride channel family protein
LTAGGGTDIEAGLVEGYREMTAFANKGFRRLVLLTDGQSDVNRFSPDSIAAAAHVPFNSNIKISTIGLGIDVKQSVLRRIAEEGKGDFYFAENSSTLTEILREELRSMLVPVVENAVLRIDVAPGVTVTEWYGIPDSLRERKSIPVSLGTLNVNDWRIIIIGIMGDSAHWNSCPVQATLRYEKYGSSEAKELSARAELPMQTAVTQAPSVNVYVARNSVLFANAQCLVKIGQLAEKSRFSEALDIIDVQIGNCNAVLGFGDRDEMEKELSSLQKVRQIVERRLQETGMQPRPVAGIQTTPVDTSSGKIPGKSDKLAHILKAGANLVIDALPGPWKTVAEIFMILIN